MSEESESVVTLFRPTGPQELALVAQSGYTRWPPRLPRQPIFYPVMNERYLLHHADGSQEGNETGRIIMKLQQDPDTRKSK